MVHDIINDFKELIEADKRKTAIQMGIGDAETGGATTTTIRSSSPRPNSTHIPSFSFFQPENEETV